MDLRELHAIPDNFFAVRSGSNAVVVERGPHTYQILLLRSRRTTGDLVDKEGAD